ncbi:MAG: hypothetical protein NC078_01665 [Ruminococcus sp.]|nr:hypothetical protein [Ruminococcus sp.]
MKVVISGLDVSEYIQQSGFSESYEKVYDTNNAFTAADGTEIKSLSGVRKKFNITLGSVPVNVKNMLRSRSGYGYIPCTVGEEIITCTVENFSAQVIIQGNGFDLWTVSFGLAAKELTGGLSGEGIYSISCDGMTFSMTEGQLSGDIKIAHNTGGVPVSGICASQMTFSIDLEKIGGFVPSLSPCAACRVIGFDAPTYYITGRSINAGVYTLTCTDRTIFLDLPFDYTVLADHADSEKTVPVGNVISEIARQTGFKSCGYSGLMNRIPYADLAATCRSILDSLSQIACGIWYCSANDSLQFIPFGKDSFTSTLMPAENERTDMLTGVAKGPISGVLMINNSTDGEDEERFKQGSTGNAYSCIKITSKYADGAKCREVYDRVSGAEYRVFSVAHCFCTGFIPVCARFYESENVYYLVGNAAINLSNTGAYASVGADSFSENEWDFTGALTRKVEKQIEAGRKYHGVSISKDGFTCEGAGGKITMSDGSIIFYSNSNTPIVNEG